MNKRFPRTQTCPPRRLRTVADVMLPISRQSRQQRSQIVCTGWRTVLRPVPRGQAYATDFGNGARH